MVRVKEWKKNGTKGWEVDIRITLPDGSRFRERIKSPVSSRSGTLRWAQQREATLLAHGGLQKEEQVVPAASAPTLAEFWPRYIGEHCEAGRQKPSTVAQKGAVFEHYLKPRFGERRLDDIRDSDLAKLKV